MPADLTPAHIWLPPEYAEDVANAPADGLVEYVRANTIAALRAASEKE